MTVTELLEVALQIPCVTLTRLLLIESMIIGRKNEFDEETLLTLVYVLIDRKSYRTRPTGWSRDETDLI